MPEWEVPVATQPGKFSPGRVREGSGKLRSEPAFEAGAPAASSIKVVLGRGNASISLTRNETLGSSGKVEDNSRTASAWSDCNSMFNLVYL